MSKPNNSELQIVCVTCKEPTTMQELSKNRQVRCLKCAARLSRESYARHTDKTKARVKEYRQTEAGKLATLRFTYAANKRNPEKLLAREKARYAIKRGWLVKTACIECSKLEVEAHHFLGYAPEHWYDIQFLCREHHRDIHKFSLRSKAEQSGRQDNSNGEDLN